MSIGKFQDSLSSFSHVKTIEELTILCHSYRSQLGFDYFIYALRIPKNFADSELIIVNGYPEVWTEHYLEHAYYNVDPIMAYCAKNVLPIQWHDLVLPQKSAEKQMMDDAHKFGLQTGISMPIHSPRGEFGILSFALNDSSSMSHEIIRNALPYIQLLAGYLHEALRYVSGLDDNINRPLSHRESECLKWAADGKAAWEIAHILGISERTVNFHVNNTMQKLEVSNRQHAVAKATLKGLIKPSPF
jgi:DNA-binding CsgD family transcriptional regulator